MPRPGCGSGRKLTQNPPSSHDSRSQRTMFTRIDNVGAATEDGNRLSASVESSLVSGAIHSERHSTHHGPARCCQITAQLPGDHQPGRCRSPGADDGDAARVNGSIAFGPEDDRRVMDLPQALGVSRRTRHELLEPALCGSRECGLGPTAGVTHSFVDLSICEAQPACQSSKVQILVLEEAACVRVRPRSERGERNRVDVHRGDHAAPACILGATQHSEGERGHHVFPATCKRQTPCRICQHPSPGTGV